MVKALSLDHTNSIVVIAAHPDDVKNCTGALLRDAHPDLTIHRLQRGTRGGDQQLGAMVATGELDAVIFFADPHASYSNDVDLIALTRLAIMHDTPIVCSPAAADLVIMACEGGGA